MQGSAEYWDKEVHIMANFYEQASPNAATTDFGFSDKRLFVIKKAKQSDMIPLSIYITVTNSILSDIYKLVSTNL